MRPLVRGILKGSLQQIRHVAAVRPAAARALVAEVYGQARREFGVLAPPLALHSPAPEALAASWTLLRETLLAEGRLGRAAKEAIATGVSRANDCPYCVEVHQAMSETLPDADTEAHRPLADWARASATGGSAPVGADEAPEAYGVAVTFHYLNRMVRLFLPDSPVPGAAPRAGRGPVLRMVARAMRPDPGTTVRPGDSLDLLPAAPLPADLAWAEGAPHVAGALARAVAAVEARAQRWIPAPVRDLVRAELAVHDGVNPGPSRVWLDVALEGLPHEQRPVASLALLIALAPYQTTDTDIERFRAVHGGDRELVELASWAALTAAVRIGARFPAPVRPAPPAG